MQMCCCSLAGTNACEKCPNMNKFQWVDKGCPQTTTDYYTNTSYSYGWICPKCGKVNAPMVLKCCEIKENKEENNFTINITTNNKTNEEIQELANDILKKLK